MSFDANQNGIEMNVSSIFSFLVNIIPYSKKKIELRIHAQYITDNLFIDNKKGI